MTKGTPTQAVRNLVTTQPLPPTEQTLDSTPPTERAPEMSAAAALATLRANSVTEDNWCDSEAPTGVVTERPLLPRPPRAPQL